MTKISKKLITEAEEWVEEYGYKYVICRSFPDFMNEIRAYFA